MEIEFDAAKNAKNIKTHGIDFHEVFSLDWDNAVVREDHRKEYGECRYRAFLYGQDGKPYSVAFTLRGDVLRVISFRRAREKERKLYEQR